MKRGDDEVRGSYISYDQPTEFFRVTGAPEKGDGSKTGRVRAVIQPKNKDAKPQPASPPVKLKPAPAVTDPRK
jgi:lipopolysaccharide export system protein LptA